MKRSRRPFSFKLSIASSRPCTDILYNSKYLEMYLCIGYTSKSVGGGEWGGEADFSYPTCPRQLEPRLGSITSSSQIKKTTKPSLRWPRAHRSPCGNTSLVKIEPILTQDLFFFLTYFLGFPRLSLIHHVWTRIMDHLNSDSDSESGACFGISFKFTLNICASTSSAVASGCPFFATPLQCICTFHWQGLSKPKALVAFSCSTWALAFSFGRFMKYIQIEFKTGMTYAQGFLLVSMTGVFDIDRVIKSWIFRHLTTIVHNIEGSEIKIIKVWGKVIVSIYWIE